MEPTAIDIDRAKIIWAAAVRAAGGREAAVRELVRAYIRYVADVDTLRILHDELPGQNDYEPTEDDVEDLKAFADSVHDELEAMIKQMHEQDGARSFNAWDPRTHELAKVTHAETPDGRTHRGSNEITCTTDILLVSVHASIGALDFRLKIGDELVLHENYPQRHTTRFDKPIYVYRDTPVQLDVGYGTVGIFGFEVTDGWRDEALARAGLVFGKAGAT